MDHMNPALKRIHQAALSLFAERGASQVNVSDLAQAANVARGTIYNHITTTEALFEEVASQLELEMLERTAKSFELIEDPAQCLSNGIRLFIRRAHEEQDWGRFLVRFALTTIALQTIWAGKPVRDLLHGLNQQRYAFREDQIPSIASLIAGSVLAAMTMVLEGHKTWREAGSDTAEFVLRSIGVSIDEAIRISKSDLPALPELDVPKAVRKSKQANTIAPVVVKSKVIKIPKPARTKKV